MGCRRLGWMTPALWAAMTIVPWLLPAAHGQSAPRHTVAARSPAQRPQFAAVVGQIRRPGVYELAPDSQLTELISRAGGLPRSASGNIRIVRNGRSGIHAFLDVETPKSAIMVRPGDVIVADAFHSRVTWRGKAASIAERAPELIPVHIAVVNLVDRPVVLPVWGQYSTVGGVLNMLGQHQRLADRLRLESAAHTLSRRQQRLTAKAQVQLVSGDVLILDPLLVHPDQIPVNLPQTYPLSRQSAAPQMRSSGTPISRLPAQVGDQQARPLSGTPLPPPITVAPPALSPPVDAQPVSDPLPESTTAFPPTPITAAESREPDVPELSDPETKSVEPSPVATGIAPHPPVAIRAPSATAASTSPASTPEAKTSATASRSMASTTDGAQSSAETVRVAETARRAQQAPRTAADDPRMTTSKWVFYGVIYSALVAVLLAALMLWQMAHTNTDSQIRTQSSTAHSAPNPLEALIRNQLKIFEQSIVLPPHLTLHGKPCREPRYRLDDGHRLPSPHIGRSSRVERPTAHQSSQPHRAPETQPAESAEPETVQVSSGERDGVEHDSTSSQTSAASDSQSAGTVTTPDPSAASAIPLPNGLRHFIKAAQNSGEGKREHDDGPHTANRTGTTPHALEQESLLDRALHRVHGAQS